MCRQKLPIRPARRLFARRVRGAGGREFLSDGWRRELPASRAAPAGHLIRLTPPRFGSTVLLVHL
uniref:Uncharacterized protein n=1 Tax=Setaria viridis TaxID=4556 RepID=A0A4U6VIK8_SETVI|nr:hypothetical protein SEVIR_3G248050v2 [Setaria viridis]